MSLWMYRLSHRYPIAITFLKKHIFSKLLLWEKCFHGWHKSFNLWDLCILHMFQKDLYVSYVFSGISMSQLLITTKTRKTRKLFLNSCIKSMTCLFIKSCLYTWASYKTHLEFIIIFTSHVHAHDSFLLLYSIIDMPQYFTIPVTSLKIS